FAFGQPLKRSHLQFTENRELSRFPSREPDVPHPHAVTRPRLPDSSGSYSWRNGIMKISKGRGLSAILRRLGFLVALSAASVQPFQAQKNEQSARVRSFNSELLQVYARWLSLLKDDTRAVTAIQSQAGKTISDRATALELLIQQSPSEALSLAFSDDLLSRLAAAFPQSRTR